MSFINLRRGHQQRAGRLDARGLSPFTGQSLTTGSPDPQASPSPPAAAPAPVVADPNAVNPHGKQNPNPGSIIVSTPTASLAEPMMAQTTFPDPLSAALPTSVVVVAPPVMSTPSFSSVATLPVTSSASSSSSTSSSSSSTTIAQNTQVIVATSSSKATVLTTPTTYRNLPQSTFIPSVTSSATPSTTSSSASSGMSTGSIVGIAVASIVGVAIVGIAGIWLLKRYFTSRDEDDTNPSFQRHSWMRNSVAVPDDAPLPVSHGPSANPRPPTMIERKQTQNFTNIGRNRYPQDQDGYPQGQGGYLLDHGGYPQDNNMGMGYSAYQDVPYGVSPAPSFNSSQHLGHSPTSAQLFFSPIASSPLPSPGVSSFDESMPPMQHASLNATTGAPVYFSRRDSNSSKGQPDLSANLADMPNPHDSAGTAGYATLDRSSVTPYQAQQYAAISKQLNSPVHGSVAEAAIPTPVHELSPFEDPAPTSAPEDHYQELTPPSPAHARIGSRPPMIPPMRIMSPVGAVAAHSSIIQIASAFPAAPTSPQHPAFPTPIAIPNSSKSLTSKERPPLSPAPGAQRQIVSVPESVHAGRETPVQFGFNDPAAGSLESGEETPVSVIPNPKRMSIASKKSVAKSGRPETMYDEDDAYGGI